MTKSKSKLKMEHQLTDDPIDNEAAHPSLRSRIRAATGIQSSVTPEDYPKSDRDEQVAAATGRDPATAERKAPDKS